MVSRAAKAEEVQIMKRPRCPPGASWRRLSAKTEFVSTPGMFLKALTSSFPSVSGLYTIRGPRRWR